MEGSTGTILQKFEDAQLAMKMSYWYMHQMYSEQNPQKKEMYKVMQTMMRKEALKHINTGIELIDYYRSQGINFHDTEDNRGTPDTKNESVFRPDAIPSGKSENVEVAG